MSRALVQPPSVMDPTALTLAETYAQALLDLLGDDDRADQAWEQLQAITAVLDSIEQAHELLTTTRIDPSGREALVARIFDGRVDPPMDGFLCILARNGRMGLLEAITMAFGKLLAIRQGRQEVTVVSAVALSQEQQDKIARELGHALQARLDLRVRVDPDVLGGLIVQVGDRVFDASVAGQLEQMKRAMHQRRMQRHKRRERRRFL